MQSQIIATARSYLGTRFHHQGRLKKTANHKGGIDCLGLLVCVARDLDLRGKNGEPLASFDTQDYSHRPDTNELRKRLGELLEPIPLSGISPADIVLLNIEGAPQHMGIACHPVGREASAQDLMQIDGDPALFAYGSPQDFNIIHAYAPARMVVEHGFDTHWQEKIVSAYRLPPH